MDGLPAVPDSTSTETTMDFDAVVIGAGVSGLYQLYRLRELGLRARVFEADVQKHLMEEEREIFPAFHAQLSKSKNQKLSRMLHMQGMKLA